MVTYRLPNIEMPQIVRCEEERKKQDNEDTMMEMKAALSLLKVISEQTKEKVCVRREIEMIRYELRFILAHIESYSS